MRPFSMVRSRIVPSLALLLAACGGTPPAPELSDTDSDAIAELASEAVPAPSPTPTAEITERGVPSASRDPAEVLTAWGKAVEMRDWVTVRAYWGDKGARSGLDERAFAAKWSSLLDPRVAVGQGESEGAAGSLYYTAPVTVTDGTRVLKGDVVLRRVNDVPGATEEQLRWHIESTTLTP
ncbi:hypothetical protein [Novosphingobium sp. LASN5T]|uniref:hypothetical protein n=1 Tax=Novosphingobium sp. LASN5T TaxID=2491021 RepID=UPI000F601BB7|nr:hypothetical protein [Novosphingobium sp. LASN5T]RQW42570.1 hypothetical protein EH199_17310 [Novosphingobium sp. LASN5T]